MKLKQTRHSATAIKGMLRSFTIYLLGILTIFTLIIITLAGAEGHEEDAEHHLKENSDYIISNTLAVNNEEKENSMVQAMAAQTSHGSAETIVVRAIAYNEATRNYTFSCTIPSDANPNRKWNLRIESPSLATQQGISPNWTVQLTQDGLYHVGCEVFLANGSLKRGDFHIDRRKSVDTTRPNIRVTETSGTSFTATCDVPSGTTNYNLYWNLIGPYTIQLPQFNNQKTISYNVPNAGLWDIDCGVWDIDKQKWTQFGYPVEFFSSGPAYLPNINGCIPGETCLSGGSSNNTNTSIPPSNTTNSTTNNTNICYTSVQNIPANCTGTITSDTYNGCRMISCQNSGNGMQVMACDKPDFGAKQYFEMYMQSKIGNGVKICIGKTCMQNEGYIPSSTYPICMGNATSPQANNTNTTNNTNNNNSNSIPYTNVKDIPATCTGGSITSDIWTGGRRITCAGNGNNLTVTAWNKPDSGTPTRFEMYKQVQIGTSLKICLLNTCIDNNNGFARSPDYPIYGPAGSGGTNTSSNNTNTTNLKPQPPKWFEPVEGQPDVEPYHFNLHVDVMNDSENDAWQGTDYELYDSATNELVWKANKIMNLHPRNGDGTFMGSLSGSDHLLFDRNYKVRARHYASGNSPSDWSSYVNFKTRNEFIGTESNWTWTAASGYKVELVAKDLNLPVTLEPAPNIYTHLPSEKRPKLYMTHLYGQLGVLLNDGTYVEYANNLLNYDDFGSLPGSGEIGVVGLYVDPSTGDLFASMSYWNETSQKLLGKIDKFTTNNDGTGYTSVKTIVSGIPVSPAHQVQEITRGPDGYLYVGTGDADNPQEADNPNTLFGKILKFKDDGSDLKIYAAGFRNPYGHEWKPGTNQMFVSNNGEDSHDTLYKVFGGETFGWCQDTCNTSKGAWKVWEQTVVPTALSFDDGTNSMKADSNGDLYVVHVGPAYIPGQVDRGKRIKQIQLNSDGSYNSESDLVVYTGDGYGTPLGLIFLDDGLYFTDLFGEQGFTGYGETKGNIYRVVQGTQTTDPAPGNDELSAAIGPARWYPQGLNMVWECKASGGTGPFTYDYYFGDGQSQTNTESDNVYHTYPANGTYTAYCRIFDSSDGTLAQSKSTTIVIGHQSNNTNPPSNNTSTFTATLSNADWYPQGLNHIWVCNAAGGNGNYTYDFNFGDGTYQYGSTQNNVYHTYPSSGTYTATCTARDTSGKSATSSPKSVTVSG